MAVQAPLCTRADLGAFGARAQALESLEPQIQNDTILARTGWICSYFAERVQLPLVSWGMDVRQACAIAVVWDLTSGPRGRNPEDLTTEDPLYLRFRGVERWLKEIADGGALPFVVGTVSPIPPSPVGSARIVSDRSRGWQEDGHGFDGGGAFSGSRGGR